VGQQPGRAFYVGEQEGHRSGGKLPHLRTPDVSCWTTRTLTPSTRHRIREKQKPPPCGDGL
jgi:hypothetical protein